MKKAIDVIKSRAIWVFLFLMIVFFAIMSDNFLSMRNLMNVAKQGSIISFVNIVAAYFMVNMGLNPILAVIGSSVISTIIGLLNGVIIAEIGMPPLIVTFASQTIFAGLAYIICKGTPISRFPESFLAMGQGYVGPIPIPVIIMVLCFAVGAFILSKTYFGRYFYAIGGNEEAAVLSGIQVKKVKYIVYALSGLFAGIAGLVMLARANTGQPNAGLGYEFDVITCVVLGGVSVSGGSGKMSNVIAGVLIIGVLSNGMVLLNVSSYMQMVIKGIILLLAVGSDCIQQKNLLKAKAAA